MPNIFIYGKEYESDSGDYVFGYVTVGGYQWAGVYSIEVEEGDYFFQDGEDRKFDLYLGSLGPYFSAKARPGPGDAATSNDIPEADCEWQTDREVCRLQQQKAGVRMTLKYWRENRQPDFVTGKQACDQEC